MSRVKSPHVRVTASLLVFLSLLSSSLLSPAPTAAQDAEPYELAATLLPLDAFDPDDPGEGFGLNAAHPLSLTTFAEQQTGAVAAPAAEEAIEEAGWVGGYLSEYWALASIDPPEPTVIYRLTAAQFTDDAGAERAYDAIDQDVITTETTIDLGDETRLVELSFDPSESAPDGAVGYNLAVLSDDIIAFVRILNLGTEELPDTDELESVAAAFLDLIDEVRDGDSPGLASQVQQVDLDDQTVLSSYYRRFDGETIQRAIETEDEALALTGEVAEHVFFHQQQGPHPDTAVDGELLYTVYLFSFADEEAAESFLADVEDFTLESSSVEEADPIDEEIEVGDASVSLAFSGETTTGRPYVATGIFTQVESLVARVSLSNIETDEAPPLDAVTRLAEAQADCLDAGTCSDTVDLGEVLGGDDTDADAGDEEAETGGTDDEDTSDDSNADADLEVYESPTYGYTLSYDPEEWEVDGEVEGTDDAPYDRLTLTNGPSVVELIGTPDYDEDELAACVDDLLVNIEAQQRNDDMAPLEEPDAAGDEDDRSWRTVTYVFVTDDDREIDIALYVDCRSLDGVTVVIMHFTSPEDYEEEAAAREELLKELEAA